QTLRAMATRLQAAADQATQAQKQAEDDQKAATAKHETEQRALAAQVADLQAKLKKAGDDLNKAKDERSEAFLALSEQLRTSQEAKEQTLKKADTDTTDLRREVRKRREEIAQLKAAKEKLEADRRSMDLLGFDQPKGRIERIDRTTGLVYINLGSADFVRQQLTFSVLPAEAVGKGALDLKR